MAHIRLAMTSRMGVFLRLTYHPLCGRRTWMAALIVVAVCPPAGAAAPPATPALPAAAAELTADSRPAGFAAEEQTLFAPVVQLAPPGPARAVRALAILDHQIVFQRKVSFHPEFDAALQKVVDKVPPRQSTLIGAAALYANRKIPWSNQPDGTHQIAVAGSPRAADYFYWLTGQHRSPPGSQDFSGVFALKPADGSTRPDPASVIGTLGGELLLDTYDIGAIVDTIAAALRECYGDLRPPWDSAPGAFNHHDQAILDRLHQQMPQLAAKLDEYLRFHNVLDEFHTAAGPIVLYNLDVEVRVKALAKYPRLEDFYGTVAPALRAHTVLRDASGNDWMRTGFDHGHIRITFMVRDGLLAPFNPAMQPAGEGLALNDVERGGFRTFSSVRLSSLGMDFGLANLGFTTTYRREPNAVMFESRMNTVPELVAPPVIHQAMDLVAGRFLEVLATGHGGMTVHISSRRRPDGLYQYAGSASAELPYAPTLAFLARIGDALAQQHDEQVRTEERAFGEELFDALVADYNNARPAILALDGGREG
jgi:hypothetical protein